MSRPNLSPEALKAIFSPETDTDFITLITITSDNTSPTTGVPEPIYLSDGYVGRLTSLTTDEEVVYGVVSRGNSHIFLPLEITLPSEEDGQAPRCSIVINDVTQLLIPTIRKIVDQLNIKLEIVLSSDPNDVQVSYDNLYVTSITYNKDTVTLDLTMIDLEQEPFPVYTFSPAYFPGLF